MNPYVTTGLVMCGVVLVALIGTSYLAVYFTRRAKADLERLMTPLAEVLDGKLDLDEAEITGSFKGHLVTARMANAAAGTVRLFQVDLVDAAGGVAWNYVYSRPRKEETVPRIEFESAQMDIRNALRQLQDDELEPLMPNAVEWLQLEYNPNAGYVRLARPMKGRNDIPTMERLETDLHYLVELARENRSLQERLRDQKKEDQG